MKKAIVFLVGLISLLGVISCEKEAETSDFFPPEIFEDLISEETPLVEEPNMPSETNPVLIGEIKGENFNAVEANLELIDDGDGDAILIMSFLDVNGSEILITVLNPESRIYEIGKEGVPMFEASFFDNVLNESFSTRETDDSKSSEGTMDLLYTADENSGEVTASLSFKAFLVTEPGVIPGKFVEFKAGNLIELPVGINN